MTLQMYEMTFNELPFQVDQKMGSSPITFNVDKNGKCNSLVLFQNGVKQTAKRKK